LFTHLFIALENDDPLLLDMTNGGDYIQRSGFCSINVQII